MALPHRGASCAGRRQWRVNDKLLLVGAPVARANWRGRCAVARSIGRAWAPVAKDALLADDSRVYFATSHFDGYPAILARLDRIAARDLEELVTEAWLARAPKRLVARYLAERGAPDA
jgi:hypothetical protein